ncbi:unnamed protein product [Effrenium voratum]|uniref:J domain-containing protein n=1 Tax=Effrenium voratum TaxID=2562239 RepID=A0AA36JDW5_9DINO|nr:unnamed protein product [Effrenium voratum]
MPGRRARALLDDPNGCQAEVILSCCGPVQLVAGGCVAAANYLCEAAGKAFSARFEARAPTSDSDAASSESDESAAGEEYGKNKSNKDKKAAGGYLKISELLKGVQLYELMGISEGASQDEIKKAYRTMALSAHPDKQATMEPDEAKKVQENFIKIQEAYELLSDPVKRKQYDSSLDFDESLPKLRSGEDFFQVFGEAFRRNARFSVKRPVPDLGSMEDEPRSWKRFYEFWDNFQSWRDPVMLAQSAGEEICDLADAECREERRWMQRENERVARKYKQQERDRIAKLVSLAESMDPRVQAEKEAKKLARQAEAARKEQERAAAQRAKEEAERAKREAEEAERAELEKKRKEEKAAKDAVRERVKKCRQRLRSFHPAVKAHVVLDQINTVCSQFEEDALRELGHGIDEALKKKDVLGAAALFHQAIEKCGLTPMKVCEDTASTTSGPTDSQEDFQAAEELRQREEQKRRRAAENEAKRQKEMAEQAEERAKLAAEKAEERKKKEEQRKKEQAAADAAKRQQEKKEEQKARKAEEKQKKQEENERLKKEQQREEARIKAQEQSEKDKQLAQAKKQEMEQERLVQLFSQDRIDRLAKLDALTDEKLLDALQESVTDPGLAGALKLLDQVDDRAVALVHERQAVWGLALPPPQIRVENALRNRVKKARNRLTQVMTSFFSKCEFDAADDGAVSEWQRGIVDGSVEIPTWEETAPEPETAPVRAQTSLTSPRRKKPKSRRRAKRMILIRSWQSWTRPKRARKQARRRSEWPGPCLAPNWFARAFRHVLGTSSM